MKQIVLFGDSLTQQSFELGGWGARLGARYARRADVLNRGFSGYNSRWAADILNSNMVKERLRIYAPNEDILFATIWLGANDASTGVQGVPTEEFQLNLEKIIQRVRDQFGVDKIVLFTPPPLDETQYFESFVAPRKRQAGLVPDISEPLDRSNELVEKYVQATRLASKNVNVPMLDLYASLLDRAATLSKPMSHFLSDGLHLNPEGNRHVFELLIDLIQSKWPDILPQPCKVTGSYYNAGSSCPGLSHLAPWWSEIDHAVKDNYVKEHFVAVDNVACKTRRSSHGQGGTIEQLQNAQPPAKTQ